MSNAKLPSWPCFAEDEQEAVRRVLQSGKVNYWTGEECKLFEKEFADFIDCPYAIALTNGTAALELALYALDIKSGDDVIVPSRTFIATANCVVTRGARPVFADVDPVSQNITAETAAQVLTPTTKAIIVVHLAGWPCDMDAILAFAAQHNLKVIEDCAQAHGAQYRGCYVGSFGDVAAFSFCQDKIMSTGGEGGMLVTKNHELWRRAWMYKEHGKNPNLAFGKKDNFRYQAMYDVCGTNFRMTEMQAAIGRIQLRKLTDWVAKRSVNAAYFYEGLQESAAYFDFTLPPTHIKHAYYKFYVFIKSKMLDIGCNRDKIIQEINTRAIPCYVGSCSEVYLERAFEFFGLKPKKRFANALKLGETSIMFPVHPTLSKDDIGLMCSVVNDVMRCQVKQGG